MVLFFTVISLVLYLALTSLCQIGSGRDSAVSVVTRLRSV